MSDEYEFNEEENKIILELLKTMRTSTRLMGGFGGVFLLIGLYTSMNKSWLEGVDSMIISAILYGAYFFTQKVAKDLQAIVDTEGSDISLFLGVIRDVTKLYARVSMLFFLGLFFLILIVYLLR